MTTFHSSLLDRFFAPFRPRRRLLDRRDLSIDVQRDIGLLDGHRVAGSIR